MINQLKVRNFKSILSLNLDCRRINVLIGRPNTGKSNILESLALLSFGFHGWTNNDAHLYVRFESPSNLFYDEGLDSHVEISTDLSALSLRFEDGRFKGGSGKASLAGDYSQLHLSGSRDDSVQTIKLYKFYVQDQFPRLGSEYLLPPIGENLVSLLLSNGELRSAIHDLFSDFGFRLGIRKQEHKLEVIKQTDDVIISYPYNLASDTLQRLVFYLAAILTNRESVLVFEEPEAHAFPYYTKYLAELIALDDRDNQYFITTHNPYFLLPILEKADKDEVAVFVTYFEDYQTKVKPLTSEQIQQFGEIDVFSNIDTFLEEN